jgi:hypothetical protein
MFLDIHVGLVPEISNEAVLANIEQKIIRHAEEAIPRINNNSPDARACQPQATDLTKTRRNANRLKLRTASKCKIAELRNVGTRFKGYI